MNRRVFSMAALGIGAAAWPAFSQVPSWDQFKPQPGSLKEKMHKGEAIRSVSAPVESTRGELEQIIKKNGKVDLFSLDGQHRPLPDERDLVKFCKLAEDLGAGVQLRIPHPRWAYMTGRFLDLGVLAILVPIVEEVETADDSVGTRRERARCHAPGAQGGNRDGTAAGVASLGETRAARHMNQKGKRTGNAIK